MSLVWFIVLLFVILALAGGAWGTFGGVGWGYYGWSPLLVIVLIVCLLWLAGVLR